MDNYLGEIRIFAGDYAPVNWAFCDGRLLNVADYEALFALLGITYGGNGTSTFGIPDLRGRAAIHIGQETGSVNNHALGNTGGGDTVTLITANLPSHSHTLFASKSDATANIPAANNLPGASNGFYTPKTAKPLEVLTLSQTAIGMAGSDQPHDNSMPSLALSYIIALNGMFPTQG